MNPTRRKPVVTWALIAISAAVFVYELSLSSEAATVLLARYGVVPGVLTGGALGTLRSDGGALGALVTPLTSMFLHGGGLHLLGNMWFLHVFGDNVEDELGRPQFLLFYLGAGLGAALFQVAVDPHSLVPMVGASGAISGVLAAYVVLHPRAPVLTLVPIPLALFVEVPAFIFIFVWFGLQLVYGLLSSADIAHGGVAWWAHVGGFVVGWIAVQLQRRHTAER
ncbi:MAG: rhomboid family intramembrane serine protease [Polyangiales bacterium]